MEGLEKERDFYFSKLRDIEVICQQNEAQSIPIVAQILEILYATEVIILMPFIQPKTIVLAIDYLSPTLNAQ